MNNVFSKTDREILRSLAARKREIAQDPKNLERQRLWLDMRDGRRTRPLVLCEVQGVRDAEQPFSPVLRCTADRARELECGLRGDIWRFEELDDDWVVEPFVDRNWDVTISPDFGVETVVHRVTDGDVMTSRSWDAPIKNIQQEFHRLKHRTFAVDRPKTARRKAELEELFGDLLPVRIRGSYWWTFGLTIQAIDLIGLEELMLDMYDQPEGLHQLLGFLRDDNLALADWLEREGLLNLNNGNDYIGSGSIGYTRHLPTKDHRAGGRVRQQDLWLLLESQETVGVGPDLYREFIFPYHKALAEKFGQVYYGCCEPLHTRWDVVREVPNLRECSIAPLCNQELMAEALGPAYGFSRKPNPTLISTTSFDESAIRADLRRTISLCNKHGCRLQLIMKDVHTLHNEPWRTARWVQLAREEIARAA